MDSMAQMLKSLPPSRVEHNEVVSGRTPIETFRAAHIMTTCFLHEQRRDVPNTLSVWDAVGSHRKRLKCTVQMED